MYTSSRDAQTAIECVVYAALGSHGATSPREGAQLHKRKRIEVSQASEGRLRRLRGRTRGGMEVRGRETTSVFGGGTDDNMDSDFDFEGNLALFDKAAVFSKISSLGAEGEKPTYRHDQNILEVKPIVYRQITVPQHQHGGKEYCTDSGLVVPSVTFDLHKRLLASAERWGLSVERRLETVGVCSSQMALALLGGTKQGVSCGRHLANHQVETVLFLPNCLKMQECVSREATLYSRSSSQQVASSRDLPQTPVDLVINCLDHHESPLLREQSWYQAAALWANQNRAPVLSIDPAVGAVPQSVEAKWTLFLGLPLDVERAESKVYLCDVGIPKRVFQEVGIGYHSPFGCKFVIPLHTA
ncbi:hypothetical protein CesoFtcFv8_000461 [Champsocephalus esox]|uniref:Enhancer of mRNA-decapping protein 3 n=1 Tax=Champsocephalus esox TaxID=159716 RepID=A0AAN8D1H7_9TELE|nr:hypothetical protein CesoFtcFv8_000461 [Champsocephalus esox]